MRNLLFLGFALLSGCFYGGGTTYEARVMVGPGAPPLTRAEVERMAAAGVSEQILTDLIAERGAKPLAADDIVGLKQAGASDAVIAKMQNTVRVEPQVVHVEQPVIYRSYAYGPYWYPSWGFSYSSWGHHSGWGVRVGW